MHRSTPDSASATPLLVTDGLDFIDKLHQDDTAAEAITDGVSFEYGPDTPELRQRNSAILADHLEQRAKRWRTLKATCNVTNNKRLEGYAGNTIAGCVKDVVEAPIGDGNNMLNRKSFKLGGFVNVGLMSRPDAFDVLLGATQSWASKAPEKDCRNTIDSGLDGAQRKGITPRIPADIYEDAMSENRAKAKAETNGKIDSETKYYLRNIRAIAGDASSSFTVEDLASAACGSKQPSNDELRKAEEHISILANRSYLGAWYDDDGTTRWRLKDKGRGDSDSGTTKPGEGTYTDSGNAANLVEQCRDQFRYVPEIATWIGWDDMCWCKLPDAGNIEHAARILASKIRSRNPFTPAVTPPIRRRQPRKPTRPRWHTNSGHCPKTVSPQPCESHRQIPTCGYP